MAFDVRRTQPKLNRRETWVQHLAEGNSIFESSTGNKDTFQSERRPGQLNWISAGLLSWKPLVQIPGGPTLRVLKQL